MNKICCYSYLSKNITESNSVPASPITGSGTPTRSLGSLFEICSGMNSLVESMSGDAVVFCPMADMHGQVMASPFCALFDVDYPTPRKSHHGNPRASRIRKR
jgi:hypothetical protein